MFASLEIFEMAHAMAVHAGHRQALVAENVANADTPGFRARDLPTFSDMYNTSNKPAGLKSSREGHLFGGEDTFSARPIEADAAAASNGNTVTIEDQMLQAVDVKRQHDRALAIYRSALTVLQTSISRN